MTEDEKKDKAIKLLKAFINDYLHGNIEELANFSFWEIRGNSDYDNGKDYPDGDCTKIAYAIDYLLYSDELPDFNIPGYNRNRAITYTGDTINTFNTLFSSRQNWREKVLSIFSQEERKLIYDKESKDDFYHVYQQIGNFMLLPSKTLCGSSINTYRGLNSDWKDYFYPFMNCLEKAYNTNDFNFYNDKNLYELSLLRKENDFFFDKINFNDFIKKFYLEKYKNLKLEKYLKRTELNKNNKDIVVEYVRNAIKFIQNRSERIIHKLKDNIQN